VASYALELPPLLDPEPLTLADGSALHAVRGGPAGVSRAGVAVRGTPERDGDAAEALELGPEALVVDVEDTELAGARAVRTLVLVQHGGWAGVVVEQWRLAAAGQRWLVTATADLASWAALAPVLRSAVATFEAGP
jgi:hypothetical protein